MDVPVGISPYFPPICNCPEYYPQRFDGMFTKEDCFGSMDKFYDAKAIFEYKLFFFDTTDRYSDDSGMNTVGPLKAP